MVSRALARILPPARLVIVKHRDLVLRERDGLVLHLK